MKLPLFFIGASQSPLVYPWENFLISESQFPDLQSGNNIYITNYCFANKMRYCIKFSKTLPATYNYLENGNRK